MYARWMARHLGEKALFRVCRQILFEECRNIDLLQYFETHGKNAPFEMASRLIASNKKFDLAARDVAYEEYVAAWRVAWDSLDAADPTDDEIRAALNSGDIAQAFQLHWRFWMRTWTQQDKTFRARAEPIIKAWLRDHSEHGRLLAEAPWSVYAFYPTKIAAEMSAGMYDPEEASYIAPRDKKVGLWLPHFQDYAFDNHTLSGMAVYSKNIVHLRPGEVPPHEKLDVRYSGLLRGVYWRERCARLGLDIQTTPWEAVPLHESVWSDTLRVDGWFYGKLYERANLNPDGSPK